MTYWLKVRSLCLLVWLPLYTVICSAMALFMAPWASRRQQDWLVRFWAEGIVRSVGLKVHIRGLEHLQKIESAILISNHASLFDIPVLLASLPVSFRMAAKVELFRIPVFGHAMKAFGFFPVARAQPEKSKAMLRKIGDRVGQGESVWMSPEGTRSVTGELGAFKMGAFYLAVQAQKPLVPIVLKGTERLLPKKSMWIATHASRPEVSVIILKPRLIARDLFAEAKNRASLVEDVRVEILHALK